MLQLSEQTTATYTPDCSVEWNGLAERMNRTLVECARCMLFDAELSKQYWVEAVETAAHIINRSPTRVFDTTGEVDRY